MKSRYYWIIGIAIAALLIVVLIGKKKGWIGGDKGVMISTAKVTRRDIVEKVSASGKIYPTTEVKISPDVPGEIIELNVHEGDSVSKGQLLVRIKPDDYVAALDRAVASLNNMKANVLNAQAQLIQYQAQLDNLKTVFERNKKLFEQKVIAQSDYDQAETQYKTAQANYDAAVQTVDAAKYNVESSEAAVKQAQDDLNKTTILAPMSGIISLLSVEKGERVVGTSQMAGTEMMRVADLYAMETRVDVNENDVLKVALGDTAEIEVDAYPDKKFYGVVSEIANSASSLSSTTTATTDQATNFTVKIIVNRDSYTHLINTKEKKFPLLPGMSCSVEIHTHKASRALAVPIQAVTTRADTSKAKSNADAKEKIKEIVFLYNSNGTVKATDVKTGVQDDTYIEITDGLKENDEVVDAPYSAISRELNNGMKVIKVRKEDLFISNQSK
jgi:HlyD family secretion protein